MSSSEDLVKEVVEAFESRLSGGKCNKCAAVPTGPHLWPCSHQSAAVLALRRPPTKAKASNRKQGGSRHVDDTAAFGEWLEDHPEDEGEEDDEEEDD